MLRERKSKPHLAEAYCGFKNDEHRRGALDVAQVCWTIRWLASVVGSVALAWHYDLSSGLVRLIHAIF
jgi:hypothetical protein